MKKPKLPSKTKWSIHKNEGGTEFLLWPAGTTTDYSRNSGGDVYWQPVKRTTEDSWIAKAHWGHRSEPLALVQFLDADQYQDGDDKWYVQMIDKTRVSGSIHGPFETLAEALTLVWRKS